MNASIDWSAISQSEPLFSALPVTMRFACRRLQIDADTMVFARGDRPRAMYFIQTGEIRLLRGSRNGGLCVLQRARHGFVAEASLDHDAYHCDAVATRATTLIAIPRKSFQSALDDQRFRTHWIGLLSRELRRARMQNERLTLRTASDRIVHCIETEGRDGRFELTLSKKDWAAELGLTHEALYRSLASMQRDGRLHVEGHRLRLRGDGANQ
jgi:CRP/FNR family transcriptional regulator, dissimilatory nitrate respiration regulator